MSNERFRDLKIGDRVFVYCHKNVNTRHIIKEVLVTEIKGSVVYPNITNKIVSVDSISVSFKLIGENQRDKQTFFIRFSEEKSRRGAEYTGFLTIEDALEFAEFLKDQKIEELQKDIEKIETDYKNLLITFEK
jgi:hypothetical protein